MSDTIEIPKLEPTTIEIAKRDGLCFESTAILFDDWELLVSTYKRGGGEVVTTASASRVKHERGYTSRTHALFQDYMETVSKAKYKRVTAKVLAQHHDDSMKLWELCVQRAYMHTKDVLDNKAS
jgi:hypothetical protein